MLGEVMYQQQLLYNIQCELWNIGPLNPSEFVQQLLQAPILGMDDKIMFALRQAVHQFQNQRAIIKYVYIADKLTKIPEFRQAVHNTIVDIYVDCVYFLHMQKCSSQIEELKLVRKYWVGRVHPNLLWEMKKNIMEKTGINVDAGFKGERLKSLKTYYAKLGLSQQQIDHHLSENFDNTFSNGSQKQNVAVQPAYGVIPAAVYNRGNQFYPATNPYNIQNIQNVQNLQNSNIYEQNRLHALQQARLQQSRLAAFQQTKLNAIQQNRLNVIQQNRLKAIQQTRLNALEQSRLNAIEQSRMNAINIRKSSFDSNNAYRGQPFSSYETASSASSQHTSIAVTQSVGIPVMRGDSEPRQSLSVGEGAESKRKRCGSQQAGQLNRAEGRKLLKGEPLSQVIIDYEFMLSNLKQMNAYECRECGIRFINSQELHQHQQQHFLQKLNKLENQKTSIAALPSPEDWIAGQQLTFAFDDFVMEVEKQAVGLSKCAFCGEELTMVMRGNRWIYANTTGVKLNGVNVLMHKSCQSALKN